MVAKMDEAGFRVLFLGIESVSGHNLRTIEKGDIAKEARRAVEICHRHGIMVIGGMIFGLPDDDEEAIRKNYQFFRNLEADVAYCQILTPYPRTKLRESLIAEGLVTNPDRFERYNGFWANVKTRHLESDRLQYAFWYDRQTALGWWKPSPFAERNGKVWTFLWTHTVMPVMKHFMDRRTCKVGWEVQYQRYLDRLERMNHFPDLERFADK